MDQTTFGLYTAIKDIRQGKNANKREFHESLNSLAAILGAGLVGIDKTNQDGYNYVKMVQNYFNSDNGWNIVMNNTTPSVALLGGGYGRDWWYDVLPNALYYAICDVFPNVDGAEKIQKSIAEQFVKADSVLNGNYDYSYFDYAQMKGMVNNIPLNKTPPVGMLMYCCVLIISLVIHVICNIVKVPSKPCLPKKKAVFTRPFYHSEFIRQPI